MKASEASTVLDLLAHLTGAVDVDPEVFLPELLALHAAAAAAFRGGALPLDSEALLWTLSEVAQTADAAWDEPARRPIEDADTGDRL